MAYAETNDFVAALNWQTKALALYSDDKKKAAAETRLRL